MNRNRILKSVISIEGERILLSAYKNEDGSRRFQAYNPRNSKEHAIELNEQTFKEFSQKILEKDPKAFYLKIAETLGLAAKVLSQQAGSNAPPRTPNPNDAGSTPLPPPPPGNGLPSTPPDPPASCRDGTSTQTATGIKTKSFRGGCKFQGKHYVVTAKAEGINALKVSVYNPRTSEQHQQTLSLDFFQAHSNVRGFEGSLLDLAPANVERIVEVVLCSDSGTRNTQRREKSEKLEKSSRSGDDASSDTVALGSSVSLPKSIGGISFEMAGLDVKVPSDSEEDLHEDSELETESKSESQLSEEADALKQAGNTAFGSGLFEEALGLYTKAKELVPAQLIYRLNCAAALLELGRHSECVGECKKIISAVRSLQHRLRESSDSHPPNETAPSSQDANLSRLMLGSLSAEDMISKAYARIGNSFYKRGRWQRALNAYIMYMKEKSSNTDALVQKRLEICAKKLQQSTPTEGTNIGLPDIEDILNGHTTLAAQDTFKFECTMCGECCRTSDYIFLSPFDIFMMTRSPNMMEHNKIRTTVQMRNHADFKDALKYTLKDGLPVCFLRPIQSKTGQCHFAYPLHLYKGKLMDYEETKKQGLEAYRPVDPSEYNLTEEEEEEALRNLQDRDDQSDASSISNKSCSDEDEDAPPDYEGLIDYSGVECPSFPEPVLNSYKRQALGCTFGAAHMPTMCASYPLANEISWVDFWHSRKSQPGDFQPFWNNNDVSQKMGWLQQEKVVVVNTPACEGFFADGQKKTSLSGNGEPTDRPLKVQTINQFMNGKSNLRERLSHQQWFMALFEEINQRDVLRLMSNERIKHRYLEQIARIWYDFDSLVTARSRPFKSYNRLQRSIETLTWTVVTETERFLQIQQTAVKSAQEQVRDYNTLLKRLNI